MTEDQLEKEALGWLQEVGYTPYAGPDIAHDGDNPQRGSYRDVVLADRLREAIARLNPDIPFAAQEDAIKQVVDLGIPGLLAANRAFHRLLINGVSVEYQKDGETRGDRVRLIDWHDASNNEYWAVNQFTVQGARHTRRPDIVLFVNGLPLVLMELKNPASDADIWQAFDQIQTYKEQIPNVFHYNEIIVISDGSDARMGSLSANAERFMQWRTIDGITLDPLGNFNELETLIRGLLAPPFLLDYLRYFVLFEDDGTLVKKIAGYHQYHAVRFAIEQVITASNPNIDNSARGKGGVVWHTQGSGKSITMTCFAARIMQEPAMQNPTVVVITDRNDLDGQLFGVFSLAEDLLRERPVQADTRQQLRALLDNRPSGGIIFTTIQKFMPGEDEDTFPELSDRRNIVVIADEAHRSQYGFAARLRRVDGGEAAEAPGADTAYEITYSGESKVAEAPARGASQIRYGYAQHLRDAFPNATFVAFTGTPVSLDDRDTRAVFGDYVHIYDVEQAVEDGATVPIYYESRLAKLELREEVRPRIDEEIEELAEFDENDGSKAMQYRRWAALEKLVGAPPRIGQVARDIVDHFDKRISVLDGKAMIVCMSREICVHMYDALVALRPEWHDPDPEKGAIKIVMTGSASDKALLRPHVYTRDVRKRFERRFKDPADPFKIVIVRDMWLTGFDAPALHTMYVDKPMRGHNLIQAISRVNRVFKDKDGGLVVDYIGIANELRLALRDYTRAEGRGKPVLEASDALPILQEKMHVIDRKSTRLNSSHVAISYAVF